MKDPDRRRRWNPARLMGLRSQEAVQSVQSLKTWKQAVERSDTLNRGVRHQRRTAPRNGDSGYYSCRRKALDNARWLLQKSRQPAD